MYFRSAQGGRVNPPPFYVHEMAGVEDRPSYAPSTPGGHAAACPYGGMDGRLVGKHNRDCGVRLRARHVIAPMNAPPVTHTARRAGGGVPLRREWSTHPHRPAGTRQRAPTAEWSTHRHHQGGHAAACPYGRAGTGRGSQMVGGFGRLTSRMAGRATTARRTAAVVKAATYDPVASCTMPENSGPEAVPMLCARLSAPKTAP